MYGLAARGVGADYPERDGYNLMTFKQSDLVLWGSKHVWEAQSTDMSKLPEAITSIRNVQHWTCVNTYVDGERVVFKRAAPDLFCRGCRASRRRKKFVWTQEMTDWFAAASCGLAKKSIPFVPLSEEAWDKWGYRAPQQEHLENRIKSRDQARKKGKRVKWDKSVQL